MKTFIKNIQGFDIYFEALPEHENYRDVYGDDDQTDEVEQKVQSGEWVLFCAKVSAELNGVELGTDYLGMCVYETEEDFYTKYKDGYFADMVDNALKEAKANIQEFNKLEA